MLSWKALINVDGSPANGRFRENEMIASNEKGRAYIWKNLGDSRTWIRVYIGASMSERHFTDWDVAVNAACELLGTEYAKTPSFLHALAEARAELEAEKAKAKLKARKGEPVTVEQARVKLEAMVVGNEVN